MRARGLTLLEVMVAVAILALGLVVILSSQAGMFSSAQHSAHLSFAVSLARCKMNEVEEELLREGFSLTRQEGEGPCCEDEDTRVYQCQWSVSSVELPELLSGSGADAGAGGGIDAELSLGPGSVAPMAGARDSFLGGDAQGAQGALGMLGGGLGGGMVGGGMGAGGPSVGAGALAPMAMGMVYPNLKIMLEASIRLVEVRVLWREGKIERDLAVKQYVTNPQQGGFVDVDGNALADPNEAGNGNFASTGAGTQPGALGTTNAVGR